MLELCILIAGFVISFILAFGIGANDVANSFGTSVGSKVLTVTKACILATIFEISGALLIGHKVSDTMRKGILDVTIYDNQILEYMLGCLSSLSASAIWLIVATFIKLPISGTHSIVGATVGFSLISHGAHGINWRPLGEIVASWFISPVASGLMSVFISFLINHFILLRDSPLEPGLRALPFIYGLTVFVNVFSIINDGPKLLYMDKISVWLGVLITLFISAVIMILVFKLLVPFLRKKIECELDPKASISAKAASDHQHEKFSKIDIEAITDENKVEVNVKIDNNNTDVNGQAIARETILTKLFTFLQILTAMFGSFAHGGNDVSNAIGPMIALFLAFKNESVSQKAETPIWILLYGGVGISIGLWVWGRRVIQTIGDDLTKIVPWTGFAIEFGSALTVLLASKMGYPVSTTHCKVGSVVFVGYASSNAKGVDWKLFRNIISAWVITVPVSALFSALIMFILSKIFL